MKGTDDFDDELSRRFKIEAATKGAHPVWFGRLRAYADGVSDHSMSAIRRSIAQARTARLLSIDAPTS